MVLCICRFPVRFVGRSTMQNQCQICTAGMKSVSMTSLCTETEGLFCISGWHQPSSDFVVCVSHAVKEWHNVLAIRHTILVCKIVVEGLWCVCSLFVCFSPSVFVPTIGCYAREVTVLSSLLLLMQNLPPHCPYFHKGCERCWAFLKSCSSSKLGG